MAVSPQNLIGHRYLQSRSNVLNGGILAQIPTLYLQNIINTTKSNFSIENYIYQFFFKNSANVPHFHNSSVAYFREPSTTLTTTVFGIIFALLAIMSCLFSVLIWIYFRENINHPTLQKYSEKVRQTLGKNSNSCAEFQCLDQLQLKGRDRNVLFRRLIICAICGLFLLIFLFCFAYTASSQSNLQTRIMGGDKNSFLSAWQQSKWNLETFLDSLIVRSQTIFTETLDNISVSLKNLIYQSLDDLIKELLLRFGVDYIFGNATKLVTNLDETARSMSFIKDNSNILSKEINIQMGVMETNVMYLKISIQKVCDQIESKGQCLQYLTDCNLLKIPINTSAINYQSSINLDFMLTQFKLNLTELAFKVAHMEGTLKTQVTTQTRQTVDKVNIDGAIEKIRPLWRLIANSLSPLKSTINRKVSSISDSLETFGNTFLIVTSLLLFVVFTLALVYTLGLSRYVVLYYFEHQLITNLINLPKFKPISVVDNSRKKLIVYKLKNRYRISRSIAYCYFLIFSLVIIIILILSLMVINLSHLFHNEACIQIWRPDGVTVTDNILDIFIEDQWGHFTSLVIPKNISVQLTLPRPSRVISRIMYKCTNDTGLLLALQMTDIINVSSIIWSAQNYKFLNDGLNLTFATVVRTNISAMIPSDMSSFISNARSIGKYFDEINYQATIDELSKNVVMLPNYPNWIYSSMNYFSSLTSPTALNVIDILRMINAKVPELQQLELKVANLHQHFQRIQSKRSNSAYIDGLLFSINQVQSKLSSANPLTYMEIEKAYTRIMLQGFLQKANKTLTNLVKTMLSSIFPCDDLSLALVGLLDNLCSSDSTMDILCSYGLNMAVLTACLMLMFQLLWKLVRSELSDVTGSNCSTC